MEVKMAKLGSKNRPAIVHVKTMVRAGEIMALCEKHGWQVIVGIEDDKPEDISDIDKLLHPEPYAPRLITVPATVPTISRNAPCPCGSDIKYKKCCGKPKE
jgi:SWIM/SEC-C metal-binding protein